MIACGDPIPKWKHEPLKLSYRHLDVIPDKEKKEHPIIACSQSCNYSNHKTMAFSVPYTTNIVEAMLFVSYSTYSTV